LGLVLSMSRSGGETDGPSSVSEVLDVMGLSGASPDVFARSIPFAAGDATGGSENEFQTAVTGKASDVDLPVFIENSNYYKNILKRFKAGETPKKVVAELEKYVKDNHEDTWENSWVRFPVKMLNEKVNRAFMRDLLADKTRPEGPVRGDAERFIFRKDGEEFIRVPVSYFLKLSLLDAVYSDPDTHILVRSMGEMAVDHFLNDNTSPETFSFAPVLLNRSSKMGKGLAAETAKRLLLTQFLVAYGNIRFGLIATGQRVVVYFAPHPPVRQRMLNDIVSDSFYRELFMNPCLSGWDRGEAKFQYMGLCHQVLSRSQLNVVSKLKEMGIITRNLVVLPNISNISLANNGTHVSLGSRKLTGLLADPGSGFTVADEKHLGDLAIKIMEHFMPLFVGTYTAAPYRLDFWDFHPERALGFLPHELDYTHLRMIWRRWIKKANLSFLGRPVTPFGPQWLDVPISKLFGLKGDFVQDFRLIDYLVALMSTDQSAALDGVMGNTDRLRKDLTNLGIFDKSMSLYLFLRLREFSHMGFSGFEGRHYSLFESIMGDMGDAVSLQALLSALAFKYVLSETVSHSSIPDNPTVESERRQIFFGTAIGIPTFYVRKDTANQFMLKLLKRVKGARLSHRYPGYIRIYNVEYRRALIETIMEDGMDLIEIMGLSEVMERLKASIEEPEALSAAGRLTRGILNETNETKAMKLSGREFNLAAERYYRETLRKKHMSEAFSVLEQDFAKIDSHAICAECPFRDGLKSILGNRSSATFLANARKDVIDERASEDTLRKLIHLTLLSVLSDMKQSESELEE
jgi:hypothetical protein